MERNTHRERATRISLRAERTKHALIARAARQAGKSRTEFILDAACREATEVLLDRRLCLADAKAYKRFLEALDAPPAENKRLRRLMARRAIREQ